MEFNTNKARWQMDADGCWVSFQTADQSTATGLLSMFEPGSRYKVAVKKVTRQRSLDASAYFWVLCGKLAAVLKMPKEDIYRNLIKDVGDNFEVVPVKNEHVERWVTNWASKGIGWVCDNAGASKLQGYTNVVCYFGSSTYDTRQMSRLIDLVVYECQQQGIETMPPDELRSLCEAWA